MRFYNVAVVGATGAVGSEFISLLSSRDFPIDKLYPFASENSVGETVEFNKKEIDVIPLTEETLADKEIDIAFFSAGEIVSKQFGPMFAKKGTIVIDNSSAFRMDSEVPLIVPEANGEMIEHAGKGSIIANPNCSTIQIIPFLALMDEMYGIESVFASTYQSVSGAGNKGIEELRSETLNLFNGRDAQPSVFPQRIAFNLIPQIGPFYPTGYCEEELKMIRESRKILELPSLDMEVTTVRVPVFYGHAVSLSVVLKNEADLSIIRDELSEIPGTRVMDDPETLLYPTPADAGAQDDILVGRIRFGGEGMNKKRVNAWIVADNIRKGAALNGIQIAETIIGGEDDA